MFQVLQKPESSRLICQLNLALPKVLCLPFLPIGSCRLAKGGGWGWQTMKNSLFNSERSDPDVSFLKTSLLLITFLEVFF